MCARKDLDQQVESVHIDGSCVNGWCLVGMATHTEKVPKSRYIVMTLPTRLPSPRDIMSAPELHGHLKALCLTLG